MPHSSVSKESACNAGDPGSIPGWGRSSGEAQTHETAPSLHFHNYDKLTFTVFFFTLSALPYVLIANNAAPVSIL